MRKQEWSRLASYVTAVAGLFMCTGCHTLKAQLAALKGNPSDTTSSSGKGASQPKIFQYWSGSTPILQRNWREVREQAASGGSSKLSTPRFSWTDHSGGSTFQDPEPSAPARQRTPQRMAHTHSKS